MGRWTHMQPMAKLHTNAAEHDKKEHFFAPYCMIVFKLQPSSWLKGTKIKYKDTHSRGL